MQLQLYAKKIWLHRQAIDFRCSIDGLTAMIKQGLQQNPQEGIYLFFNRSKDKIKGLFWHKNGYILLYKRLESGRFHFQFNDKAGIAEVLPHEFGWLLAGLEWQKMSQWRELNYDKFS